MARRQFLAMLSGLPFLSFASKPQESKKPLKIMMKKCLGFGRSHACVISVFAWASARGSGPRSADLSYRRSDLLDAQSHYRCDSSRWVAVTAGNT